MGPDRWVTRTGHIGDELVHPMHRLTKHRISVVENTQQRQLLHPTISEALKHVLHKGYWRFKPQHYRESRGLKTIEGKDKDALFKSPREGFDSEILQALAITEQQTELEQRFGGQAQFDLTDQQLEEYVKARPQREAARAARRKAAEAEKVRIEKEIERKELAEKEQKEREKREFENLKRIREERRRSLLSR